MRWVSPAWMRADGHTVLLRPRERPPHRRGISCVPTAGHIRRSHDREQRRVAQHSFAQIRIQVDVRHAQTLPVRGRFSKA